MEGFEGGAGDAEVNGATAAVDDGTGGDGDGAEGIHDVDDFAGAAAGGDDVLNNDGAFAGFEGEAAAEGHFAVGIAFGEDVADAEGAGDFVADDEATERGGNDDVDLFPVEEFEDLGGEFATEGFGVLRVLEDDGGLEVVGAVESAGEAEMAGEVGAGLTEDIEDVTCFAIL